MFQEKMLMNDLKTNETEQNYRRSICSLFRLGYKKNLRKKYRSVKERIDLMQINSIKY